MLSSTLTRTARTLVFVTALMLLTARLHAASSFDVIRVLSPVLTETLNDLYRTSPAARAVIDELEQSNLIIHVQRMKLDQQQRFSGTMRFVFAAGGRRFLRIAVNERLAPDRRAAALAHELQHALEVARAPHVHDRKAFSALYRVIGRESLGDPLGECYETDAAQRIGTQVMADYRAAAMAARRARTAVANSSH